MLRSIFCLLLLAGFVTHAAEKPPAVSDSGMAQIPYSKLLEIQQMEDSIRDMDQLQFTAAVNSTQTSIKPGDIRFTIMRDNTHGGPQIIPVDADGHFHLPVTPALQQEDPIVVSNMPAHTMHFSFHMTMLPPTKNSLHYSELMRGVQQYNQVVTLAQQTAMKGMFPFSAKGLLLTYLDGGHSVTLHTRAGDKMSYSKRYEDLGSAGRGMDMSGMRPQSSYIYLPLDPDLLKEDPEVTLDALPPMEGPSPG